MKNTVISYNYDNCYSNCTMLVSYYSPGNAEENIRWLLTNKIYQKIY